MKAPTARQREVLETIRAFISANGFPPTYRDLGKLLGIGSTNGVKTHLWALEKKGLIATRPNLSRGITITEEP